MPNLCNYMATDPTKAPHNTEIIIAIHKQNELVEDYSNSLNIKRENRNPHKYPTINRVGCNNLFPYKHSKNPTIIPKIATIIILFKNSQEMVDINNKGHPYINKIY